MLPYYEKLNLHIVRPEFRPFHVGEGEDRAYIASRFLLVNFCNWSEGTFIKVEVIDEIHKGFASGRQVTAHEFCYYSKDTTNIDIRNLMSAVFSGDLRGNTEKDSVLRIIQHFAFNDVYEILFPDHYSFMMKFLTDNNQVTENLFAPQKYHNDLLNGIITRKEYAVRI